MGRPKRETPTNGATSEILALVPTAEALREKVQDLRDELARAEALLECVERMRGACVSPLFGDVSTGASSRQEQERPGMTE